MSTKIFYRVLLIILAVCALFTLAHLGYILYVFPNASIIKFIANELW